MDCFSLWLYVSLACTLIGALSLFLKPTRGGKLPPGPAPLPLLGNLFNLGNKPHRSLAELAKTHGPVMTVRVLGKTTVVISSSDMAKEALQKQDLSFSAHRVIQDCARALHHNQASVVWLPISAQWRNLRKICNSHLFTTQTLDSYCHLRRQKVQQLLQRLGESSSRGEAVDIGGVAFATSINLLSNTILSMDWVDLGSDSAQQMKGVVWGLMEVIGKDNLVDYFPKLSMIDPQGIRRRMAALMGKLFEVFDSSIDQRLKSRKLQSGPVANKDVLDILLQISQETKELSVNDIPHLLTDLFAAGTDTTSSTVEWAMAELLHNPRTLSKARAEMEQVLGKGNPLEEKDIPKLPYLQAVVKETLRLHPPVPFLVPRRVETEVDICSFNIPKGTQVLVNAWAIGRDPDKWTHPDSFMPERFLGSDLDVKGRNFELIPFGAGRRICPGLPLAIRMVHMMVGSMIHSFEWVLQNGVAGEDMDMEEKFGLTLQKAKPLFAVPTAILIRD